MRRAPVFVALVLAACSGGGGDPRPQPAQCTPAYQACSSPSACCTGDCVGNLCAPSSLGEPCRTAADCAPTLSCVSLLCANPSCRPDGQACSYASQCCANHCRRNAVCGPNRAPAASAGADFEAAKRVTVTLDGSGSTDPDGDTIYLYSWTLQRPTGSFASFYSDSAVRPSFQTDVEGSYVATLQVWDGLLYGSDSVTVTVVNHPPVAEVGTDREVPRNKVITLDAYPSSDPDGDGLTYWIILSSRPAGSTAVLQDWSAPWSRTLQPDLLGDYTVTVTVSDGKLTGTTSVVLTAVNVAPEAHVTAAAAVNLSERVDVASTGSRDQNGDPLTYAWRLDRPAGSSATLSPATGTSTSYLPDVEGTYTVFLDLFDGRVTTTASQQTVVHPRVVKLSHDVFAATCGNVFCSTIYMVSRAPANELWRFFVVPGDAEMKLTTLSGPPLAVGASGDGYAVVGLSGKVGMFLGTTWSECPLPQWTDSTGALRTYDAGGVALGPNVTIGTGKTARTTRFAFVVPAATANGGMGTLSVDMGPGGSCAVTTSSGPQEGFVGAVALRPGTTSLYVLGDGSPGQAWIYDTSGGPAALTTAATLGGSPGAALWFMDGGATFVTPAGAIHASAPVFDGAGWTIPLAGELGNPSAGDPKHLVVHASSSATAGRIAAIPATGASATPLDVAVRTYSATTWAQTAAVPLPAFVRAGTAYPTRGRFVAHRTASDSTIWVIEQTEPGVTPAGWAIAPLEP
jgi:hypothetical protein